MDSVFGDYLCRLVNLILWREKINRVNQSISETIKFCLNVYHPEMLRPSVFIEWDILRRQVKRTNEVNHMRYHFYHL
jgi:hypothetical protein